MKLCTFAAMSLIGYLAGCGGNDAQSAASATVSISSGDGQAGYANIALTQPLKVLVTDAAGSPAPGKTVTWVITAGGGVVFPATSVAGADGIAATTFVPGTSTATQYVVATAGGSLTATFSATAVGSAATTVAIQSGNNQVVAAGATVAQPLVALVSDDAGAPAPGRLVTWTAVNGGGTLTPTAAVTDANGMASTSFAATAIGVQNIRASVTGGSAVTFNVTPYAPPLHLVFSDPATSPVVTCTGIRKQMFVYALDANGNTVPTVPVLFAAGASGDRLSYDSLATTQNGWAIDTIALGATLGAHPVTARIAGTVAPLTTTFTVQAPCPVTFTALVLGAQVVGPGSTVPLSASMLNDSGVVTGRTVTWTVVSGGGSVTPSVTVTGSGINPVFTTGPSPGAQVVRATTPGSPAIDVTITVLASAPRLVATVPMPTGATYDHDAFVRDGIAFVFAWNKGVLIYDVGNGVQGGSPSNPQLISQLITSDDGIPGGPAVHNGWWFQNPVTGAKRYLFIGQEGPLTIGASSSGDIHIVDVSDLARPVEVGFIRVPGAGAHNFWMDEAKQTLYAAFYNGGVVKIDVSGTLSGDMSSRVVAESRPGGPGNTFTWGVMLSGSTLYASDMLSGFWALDPVTLAVKGGGAALPVNWGKTSDLWVTGSIGYTGNWGNGAGAAIAVWSIGDDGVPTLVNAVYPPSGTTVSDVAVTPDGRMLVATTEGSTTAGLLVWDRVDPIHPVLVANYVVPEGLHTAETKVVNGRTYVFAARDPSQQELMIFDITDVVH